MRRARLLGRGLGSLLGLLVAAYILAPFLWVAASSIQPEKELFRVPPRWIPRVLTADNYRFVFTGQFPAGYEETGIARGRISEKARDALPALRNSTMVAVSVAVTNLVLGTMAAYTFSRLRFRGAGSLYTFVLASRLLPPMAVAIPYYLIVNRLGLLDRYAALVLIHSVFTLPFSVWFLTLYFRRVPPDMEEAALVDGCTRLQALLRVVAPMTAPALAATAAFSFMFSYNDFPFALFVTSTIRSQTIPVIVANTAINPDVSFGVVAVTVVLTMLPPVAFAMIFRNYITRGLIAVTTTR
ncbi:MAG: carbohydrate ABC transporter permease [Armatimonadota bacterium]|nr:carbohydrate ABC transporter permease [Armatimonadota bacterium]MDR7427788.1 carbohydrate ABC transporter permease [Armatimonadota bacterium]MDR7464024.1 carbohydrate ABC transporter permease [Armatimonadota bacterium]MDR7468908.1 carbohydrate ABC transporter permease [Armatimonadota bacterium]MDR7474851.1 carbohydrate ABC transporter permease [Armatimonadota bacterium]